MAKPCLLFLGLNFRLLAVLIVALTVLPNALAAPQRSARSQSNTCVPSCRKSHDSKLNYEEGKSYVYDFTSESITQLVGSSDESSKLQVKGQAVLTAQSACDFILSVQQAAIEGPNGQAVSQIEGLEGSSVRFAFQDGAIEGLCVSDEDPTWSSNIKRALVSMLQNKALKNSGESIVSETDVSGRCPTQYKVSGDKYVKSRDLNSCTHRDGGNTIIHGVPYNVPSKHNSLPGVDSNLTCTQQMSKGIFESVTCQEIHRLEAFSQGEAGAQTKISTSMKLVSSQARVASSSAAPSKPSSILYDHADQQEIQARKQGSSYTEQVLARICSEIETGVVSAKVPGLFLQLQKSMKSAQVSELKAIHDQIRSEQMCPKATIKLNKLLLDAAAMSASDAGIALLADIETAGKMNEETKTFFHLYMTFAPAPGSEALKAVGKLLERQESSGLILSASGLAHQYCKMTNVDCVQDTDYIHLVNQIARIADSNCISRSESKASKAVAALQALGNLDELTPEGVAAITKCMQGSERMLVRALDAFRRDPCQRELKEPAREIMSDKSKNSEIRIQAYLALSKCLEPEDVEAVQKIFNKGKSNQVMSFIASHVRNQLDAAAPGEQQKELKSVMKGIQIPSNIPEDVRKYSRNFEWSSFNPETNFGGSMDANLIFSQNSYVPRMVSGNMTVHTFGRSYNLVELGAYLANFEHALEKYFGPTGSLKDSTIGNWINRGQEKIQDISNLVHSRVRRALGRRSNTLEDHHVQHFHNEVDIHSRYGDTGMGDVYVRIMGTSVLVESFNQNTIGKQSIGDAIKQSFSNMLQGDGSQKVDLTQPIMFMNDEMRVPTIGGFPLNFDVKGTTVLSLQMSGDFDLEKLVGFSSQPQRLHAKFAPSAATTMKARMSTGCGPIEVGLQVEGKIQSSSNVDIVVKKGNNEYDLKINLPEEKTQILGMSSELFWVEQVPDELEKKSPMTVKTPQKSYARPDDCMVSNVFGLKLCAIVKVPEASPRGPAFPLSGPSQVSLSIEKTESSMEGYHFKIVTRLEDEAEKSIQVMMDTPGSQTNRKLEAMAKYVQDPTKMELQIDSPWKNFNVLFAKDNTDELKSVSVQLTSDGKKYGAKAQMKISGTRRDAIMEPLVQYSTPSGEQNLIDGRINWAPEQKLKVDLRTDAPSIQALRGEIKADIEAMSEDKYKINALELNYPSWGVGKLGLTGSVKLAEPTSALKMDVYYGKSGHTLDIESKFMRIPKQRLAIESHVKSSRNPAANFDLNWEASVDPQTDAMEHKLLFVQGLAENKLTVKQRTLYDTESSKNFEILNELEVTKPVSQWDFKLRMDAKKEEGKSQKYEMLVQNGASHKAELKLQTGADAFFDYKCSGLIQYPGQSYELSETASKTAEDTFKYLTTFNAQPGNRYDAVTMLVLKNERGDTENSLSTTITSGALPHPINFKTGFVRKTASIQAQLLLQTEGESKIDIKTGYKYSGGKPHAIDMKAKVKNYLDMELSETHSKSSSNLNLKFKWVPSDRQIVAESVYNNQAEKFNFDGQVQWDAEKDDSKSAKIKSVTILGAGWSMETNNDIIWQGKSANFQLKGKIAKNVLDGEHVMDVSYRSPNNKNYGLHVKNLIETTPRVKSSKLNARVQLADSEPYVIEWENRFANFDTERLTFEILTDMKATYEGQQNLQIHGELNSLLTNKRVLNGHYGISGSALSSPVSLDHSFELRANGFKIATNGKYGTKASSFELGVKHDLHAPRRSADIIFKLTLPTNPKSIEGNAKYLWSFKSFKNFEVSEVGSLILNNGVPTTWSNIIRATDNEFQVQTDIVDSGTQTFNLGVLARKDKKRVVLDLSALMKGHGAKFFTNIEGHFPYYNLRANGTFSPHKSSQNYDFKLYHRSAQGGRSIDTELTMHGQGSRFVLTNKLENYPKRKGLDLLFTDGSTPRKVYILLTENTPKWSLDGLVKWGEGGKAISTKGGFELGEDLLDAVVSIDSPALNIQKWSARVSRKFTSGRRSLALNVEGKHENVISLGLEYAKKKERHGETYDGSVKIDGKKGRFNGDFRVENNDLDRKRDGEDGKQIKATLQLQGQSKPMKMIFLTKTTDVEKRLSASFCNDGESHCKIGDVILRHEFHQNDDVDYTLKITTQSVVEGDKTTDGVLLTASRAGHGKLYEHILQLIINEEKESQVGYRMYRKVGKEVGLELQLPHRLISTVAKTENKAGSQKAEISLWMDKHHKPEEKLSAAISIDDITSEDDSTKGVQTLIVVRHPAMPQDMRFKSKLIKGGSNTILDFVAEADIFKQNGKLVTIAKIIRKPLRSGQAYDIVMSAVAPSLSLNAGVRGELKQTPKELSLQSEMSFENHQKVMKKSKMQLAYSEDHVNFAMRTGGSQPIISLSTQWNNREKHDSSGHDIRYEIMLPGMADARIFEAQIHSSIPPHANVKMYTATSPAGDFYEAFIGFKSDKRFSAGLYKQTQEERQIIEDWSLELKSPRLLMVKADWDKENIEATLHEAQQRLQQTGDRFKEMMNSTLEISSEELQHLWSNFEASLPDLEPISQSYRQEMKQIRQELRSNPETLALNNYLESTEEIVQQYFSWASSVAEVIYDNMVEAFNYASRFASNLPNVLKSLRKKIPIVIQNMNQSIGSMVDAIVKASNKAMEEIQNVMQKIAKLGGFDWEFLTEASNEIAKYVQKGLDYAVNGFVDLFDVIKSASSTIIDHPYVKKVITRALNRYQNLLADVIDEIKNQAEAARENLLSTFPQQEVQEFVLALYEYAEKKARGMEVDDTAAHKDIYDKFMAAVRKAGAELYTVDWQNGLIVAQIPLPKPIDSLSDFDQLFLIDIPSWKSKFNKPAYSYGLTEVYNFVKADALTNFLHRIFFTTETTVPPMPAYALLVGSQYFRTFDGKFYHFQGNCQYLLASDFVDKNFTIAVDYEGEEGSKIKKNILINYHGEKAVIKHDFTVQVQHHRGGEERQLLKIEDDSGDLTLHARNGALTITCAKKQDVCLFTLSGYYHGKTMGLFGTNNHEHFDDFSSPQGQILDNPEEFVASWKLDEQCQEKPIPAHPGQVSQQARDVCAKVFQSKRSMLRSCYDAVEPDQYQQICEALSPKSEQDPKKIRKAMCSASAAYAATCATSLVRVEIPSECKNAI